MAEYKTYRRNILRQIAEYGRSIIRDPAQFMEQKEVRICSCCGYTGHFISMRQHLREMRCPNCASRPRDRLLAHAFMRNSIDWQGKHILHFSPEPNLYRRLHREPGYISGDIKKSRYAKHHVDVTRIAYPAATFDIVICNHVMEHVDDHMAGFMECCRVLKPDGIAFFSVPYAPDRADTWYPPPFMTKEEDERICGWDHKRIYGRDFPDIVARAGFTVTTYLLDNAQQRTFQTTSNDPIFIAKKVQD